MTSNQEEDIAGSRKRKHVQIEVERPVYTESDFQKDVKHYDNEISALDKLKRKVNKIEVTPKNAWHFICKLIPILNWLPDYNFRNDIIGDTISGITIAIMRVPQEMAFAILATLPAISGLYTAFFSVLTYAVFGTSRHISIGTWAVGAIMVGEAIDSIVSEEAVKNPNTENEYEEKLRIQIGVSLCLLIGIIQVGMGIFRLGIVTIYLSEPLVRGFTTGAAVHVFTSQFPKLFGVSVTKYSGVFALVYTYIEFFSELSTVNTCAICISIISVLILVIIGEINDRQAAKDWCRKEGQKGKKLPIPSELLVVIFATLASDFGRFEEKYGVGVVGNIPTGLPAPTVPPVKYFSPLIGSAIAIAIVGFAISISLTQLFARKHNYEVDANQEFKAIGGTNIVGSFFQCFPSAASMSRSLVQEGSGGKTQLASIFACVVVLCIILWLGPLLAQLPECALASIIVVALRGMFRQFTDLMMLWKVSLTDFLLWLVTFTLVVFLGVDLGLLLGVIFALITIVVRSQSPYCSLMGRVPNTDIYRDIYIVQGVEQLPGIKIFRSSSSLSFINAEHFRNSLFKKTGVNPRRILIEKAKGKKKNKAQQQRDDDASENLVLQPSKLRTVIIECGMFTYVDVVGVKTLQSVVSDYHKVGIDVIFANCKAAIRKSLATSSTINKKQEIGLDRMYISLHDAVLSCIMGGARTRAGTYLEQLEQSLKSTKENINRDIIMESGRHREYSPADMADARGNKNVYVPDIHDESKSDTDDTNV